MFKLSLTVSLLIILQLSLFSQEWIVYDCKVLPDVNIDTFVQSNVAGDPASNTIIADPDSPGNLILELISPGADPGKFMWKYNFPNDMNDSLTLVFRLKAAAGTYDRVMEIDLQQAGYRERLYLMSDNTYRLNESYVLGDLPIGLADWHIVRISKEADQVAVYVDEQAVSLAEVTSPTTTAENYFRFGDGNGSSTLGGLVDWIAWDTTGAYAPWEGVALPDSLITYHAVSDASLASLTNSTGSLTPAFNPDIFVYDLNLTGPTTSVTLTATANDAGASVTGDGTFTMFPDTAYIEVTAQDGLVRTYQVNISDTPNNSLLITEARMDDAKMAYLEITNMGTENINLAAFELGNIRPWADPWNPEAGYAMMLPDVELTAGESYVIASAFDFMEEQYALDVAEFGYSRNYWERQTKKEMWELADLQVHFQEINSDATDSVSDNYLTMDVWAGRECWYLRHHISGSYSTVTDQVGGVFDVAGRNSPDGFYDVAGVPGATGNTTLIRKFSVKEGELNFDATRGTDPASSSWMPVPFLQGSFEPFRAVFWTVGNHGNYLLNDTTLVSDTVDIDWDNSILTVPWGVRNDDSIMYQFKRMPGLAWHYDYAPSHEDSAYVSVRTGDVLTVYACGNELNVIVFDIIVSEPAIDANIVIPKRERTDNGDYAIPPPFKVSDRVPGMDTISNVPFATRRDTLLKYLEKAPNASWEFVWVDGTERTDLKDGDILRITAEDEISIKDYYIKVQAYFKNGNAHLSSITWPDIPDAYRDLFGWIGDTVANFSSGSYDYKIRVPWDYEGIPALVAKTVDINATVAVDRATNLYGSVADRTVTFTVTAEDDTSTLVYRVQMDKDKNPANIQPWQGEPFISEFVFWDQWNNGFIEIANPGTEPLDLSDYMIFGAFGYDTIGAITSYGTADGDTWLNRYRKYIPGYKWQDSLSWLVQPAIAEPDPGVDAVIQPGDVFVMGGINSTAQAYSYYDENSWPAEQQCDVIFNHPTKGNNWGENVDVNGTFVRQWTGADIYLYKILNESVKNGLKPATDPDDFQLIEIFGHEGSTPWTVGGVEVQMTTSCVRKPEYYEPRYEYAESFGTTPEDSEWELYDWNYFTGLGLIWPLNLLSVTQDLGTHFMNDVTIYRSTVSSLVYIVSEGYSMSEMIRGVVTGTTASEVFVNTIKADPGQARIVVSSTTGIPLAGDDAVNNGDSLIVVSADGNNTSAYILEVNADGLSDDAVLTSSVYTISVSGSTGTISGFSYGATVREVYDSVSLPAGARMTIIDADGTYVPLQTQQDTGYTETLVGDFIFFEVIAEDNATIITYHLQPDVSTGDAYLISVIFNVNNELLTISGIPSDFSVPAFWSSIEVVTGATAILLDKSGMERTQGIVAWDDILEITSSDLTTIKQYQLNFNEEFLVINPVVSSVLCYGESNGSIRVDMLGLIREFEYSVDGGASWQADSLFSGLPTGSYDVAVRDTGGIVYQDQLTINQPDSLSIGFAVTDVDCDSGIRGSIDLTVSGGTGVMTFLWSNDSTAGDISGLLPGMYTVTVSDENTCMAIDSIEVLTAGTLPVLLTDTIEICPGDSSQLAGPAGYEHYEWSTGVLDTNQITIDSQGAYWLEVSDSLSCTGIDTAMLIVYPEMTLQTTVTDYDCETGTGGSIDLVVNSGTAPFGYLWSNDSTGQDISGLEPGEYSVIVLDGNMCLGNDTVNIGIQGYLQVSLVDSIEFCNGEDSTIIAPEGYSSYEWSNGISDTNRVTVDETGIIVLMVTAAYNCENEPDTVIVIEHDIPPAPEAEDKTTDYGAVVPDLTATGDNIRWYAQADSSYLGEGASYPTGETASGTYSYLVTQIINICESPYTQVSLTIKDPVIPVEIPDTSICNGDTAIYQQTEEAGHVYSWIDLSTGEAVSTEAGAMLSPTVTTDYVYKDSTTATHSVGIDTFRVTVNPLPEFTYTVTNNPIYQGYTTSITISGAAEYTWSPNDPLHIAGEVYNTSPNVNTQYTVTGTTAAGCVGDTVIAIYVFCEECEANTDLIFACGTINTGCTDRNYRNSANCQWAISPDQAAWIALKFDTAVFDIKPGDWLKIYEGNDAGGILINTYDNNNLPPDSLYRAVRNLFLHFSSDASETGTGFNLTYISNGTLWPVAVEVIKEDNIRIYPNPNSGTFILEMSRAEFREAEIEIYSVLGQKIFNKKIIPVNGSVSEEISLENFPGGLYYLRMNTGKIIYQETIILE